MLTTLLSAALAFAATNLDDIVLLTVLFAQSRRRGTVVAGQFLGFGGLVGLSLLGYLGSLALPAEWIGLLGLAPIGLGLRAVWAKPAAGAEASDLPHPSLWQVTALTLANGADNIGIYTPLFAASRPDQLALTLLVFFGLLGVWCWLGWRLSRQPAVAGVLRQHGRWLVPVVLIGLGVYLVLESGLLARLL